MGSVAGRIAIRPAFFFKLFQFEFKIIFGIIDEKQESRKEVCSMSKNWLAGTGVLSAALVSGLAYAGHYSYKKTVGIEREDFVKELPPIKKNDPLAAEKRWYRSVEREMVTIQSAEGLELSAVYIPAATPSDKVAIMAHGYTGNLNQMSSYAKLFYDLGFAILAPDARGHGLSEGTYIGFGWHERMDFLQWIQLMIDRHGPETKIALFGISMGGATVMNVSGETLPPNVKVIVEDCGFTSVAEELAYQLKQTYHLPAFPLLHVTSLITKIRAGYWFEEASPLNQLKKNKLPILFIHGEEDRFVPTKMVHQLYEATSSPKELYLAPKADHGRSYTRNKEEYKQRVRAFVSRYIPE